MTINPARIGTSEAGRRILDAGIAFQARRAAEAMRKLAPLPEPEPPPTARTKLFLAPIEEHRPSCRRIIDEVAKEDGVSAADIVSERRLGSLIAPRHKAMYRCRMETPFSLPQIGKAFNRDHTTIGYGIMAHCHRTGDPPPQGMKWRRREFPS